MKQSASTTLPAGGCHNCFLVRTALRANRSLCRFLLFLQFCVCIRVSGRIRGRACGFEVSSRAREGSKDNVSACHPMAKATQVRQVRISGQVSCSSLVLGAWYLVQSVHAPGQGGGWRGAGGGDDTRAWSTARNVSRLTPHGEARGTSHDTLAIRI